MVRQNIKNKLKPNKAFTEETLEALRSIQLDYSRDFIPLFERLSGVQVAEVNKKTFTSLQGAGNQIFEIIQRLIDSQGKPLARDIEDLFLNLDFVENQILEFKQRLVSEGNISEDFQKITGDTKKSLDDILKDQKEFRKGIRQPRRGFFKGQLESGSVLKQVFGGVAAGVLGPFTPLAQIASKDIFRLFKGLKQRRLDKEKIRFGEALAGSGVISEDATKQFEGLTKGKGARVEDIFKPSGLAKGFGTTEVLKQTGAGVLSGVLGPFAPLAQVLGKDVSRLFKGIKGRVGRRIPEGITSLGDVFEQAPKDIIKSEKKRKQSALFQFFDKDAFKAKWTKRVLRLLGGGLSKTGKEDGGGFLSGILTSILGIGAFKKLKGVLGKVALGFAGLLGIKGLGGIKKSFKSLAALGLRGGTIGLFIAAITGATILINKAANRFVEIKSEAQRAEEVKGSVKFSAFKKREEQRRKEKFLKFGGQQQRKEEFFSFIEKDSNIPFSEEVVNQSEFIITPVRKIQNIITTEVPELQQDIKRITDKLPVPLEELKEGLSKIASDLKKGLKEISENFKPVSGTTAIGKSISEDLRKIDDTVLDLFNSGQIVLP